MEKILNQYKIIKTLQKNEPHSCYISYDEHFNEKYYIYEYSLKNISAESLYRFKSDIKSIIEFPHKNVLKIESVKEKKDKLYIIKEFFKGQTLNHCLHQLDLWSKIEIIKQCASTLQFFHNQNIIHKSLNLKNIWLNIEDINLKITNFGIFNLIDFEHLFSNKKNVNHFFYTPPEQTGLLKRAVDARSDLYSLGIIFYYLLTGKNPFISDEIGKLIHLHLSQTPPAPSKLNPDIPPVLDKIVLKLIEKEPDRRYQTAKGLKEDLEYLLNHKNKTSFLIGEKDKTVVLNYQIKMVGREKQLEILKQNYESAQITNNKFTLIKGKSGIGKTKLIESFNEQILDENTLFLVSKCTKATSNIPYAALSNIFEDYFKKYYKAKYNTYILNLLGDNIAYLIDLFPFLKNYFQYTPTPKEDLLKDRDTKTQILQTICDFLNIIAHQEERMIFCLDDINWADQGTIDLLNYLSLNLKNPFLNLICTYSDEEIELTTNFNLLSQNFFTMKLNQLNKEAVIIFTQRMLNQENLFEDSFYDKIYQISNGEPVILMEAIKTLKEENILYNQDYEWEVNYQELSNFQFDNNISKLIIKKLNSLDHMEKEALLISSVFGQEVNLIILNLILAEIFEKEGPKKWDVENTITILKKLQDLRIITEEFTLGKDSFWLSGKVNEIIYHLISDEKKEELHLICAKTLENFYQHKVSEKVFQIAYHYNKTKVIDKIMKYNEIAYKIALDRYALNEAIHYIKFIADIKLKSDQFKREDIELFLRMNRLLYTTSKISLGLEYMTKLLKIAKKNKWDKELLDINLNIGTGYYLMNNTIISLQYYNEAMNLAQKRDEEITIPTPYTMVGSAYYFKYQLEKAEFYFTKAIEYTDENKLNELLPLLGLRSWVYSTFGDFERAEIDIKFIEENLKEINNPIMLSSLYHFCSLFYSWSGEDIEKALKYSFTSYEYAVQANAIVFQYSALYSRMVAYFLLNQFDKCEEIFEKALKIASEREVNISIQSFYALMAQCYLYQQNFEKANSIATKHLFKKEEINDKQSILSFLQIHSVYLYVQGQIRNCLEILDEGLILYESTKIAPIGLFFLFFKKHILEKIQSNKSKEVEEELNQLLDKKKKLIFLYEKFKDLIRLIEKTKNFKESATTSILKEKIQLENIIKTSQLISSVLDINDLLNMIIEKTIEVTGAQRGALLIYNIQKNQIEYQVTLNISRNIFKNQSFEELISKVKNGKMGLIINRNNFFEYYLLGSENIKSALCTPLILKGNVVGILYLDSNLIDDLFSKRELDILEVFTVQAAIAIENATLYNNLEKKVTERTKELQNLNELSNLVNSTFSIMEIIKIIYNTFHNLFGIEGIGVQSVDERSIRFIEIYAPSLDPKRILKIKKLDIPFSMEGGTCYLVATTKKYFYASQIDQPNKYPNRYDKIGIETFRHKSVLILPLEVHNEVIGLIQFFSYTKELELTETDISTINRYSNQVATAINNSRIYNKLDQEKQILEELNEELKNTQTQLVQSEKMASLGQLTAGIAHEINNPLSFVINNSFIISKIINSSNKNNFASKMDDIKTLSDKNQNGLDRIKKIVENLRSFSRMDEGKQKLTNINECILSALSLLEHLLKEDIVLEKKLNNLPQTLASPGQLNQVFMNIIVNAIDAVSGNGKISIETSFTKNKIKISITDTGKGIPDDIINNIFDPFFTTKEIGKGTGLGLSISYGIIQDHGGDIKVKSHNKGTTFIIELPIAK